MNQCSGLRLPLLKRADDLMDCIEGSGDDNEVDGIMPRYEVKHWPEAKETGGKSRSWREVMDRRRLQLNSEERRLEVHLAYMVSMDQRLWLRCDACGHEIYPQPQAFAREHQLEMTKPLLLISRRLRCSKSGSRKCGCRPEPCNNLKAR